MAALIDLTGQRFGRLSVRAKSPDLHKGRIAWLCVCDCGSEKVAIAKTLISGSTQSCGCLLAEKTVEQNKIRSRPLGFERVTSKGYVEIKTESGFKRKHVYVMEQALGRSLIDDEVVHHIDRDKRNNELSNLQLMTHAEHTILHNTERGLYGKHQQSNSRR